LLVTPGDEPLGPTGVVPPAGGDVDVDPRFIVGDDVVDEHPATMITTEMNASNFVLRVTLCI